MSVHDLDHGQPLFPAPSGSVATDLTGSARYDFFESQKQTGLNALRVNRNQKLIETDWMANNDVSMSLEWKTYRQQLRDITETYSNPSDVVWPTKPE